MDVTATKTVFDIQSSELHFLRRTWKRRLSHAVRQDSLVYMRYTSFSQQYCRKLCSVYGFMTLKTSEFYPLISKKITAAKSPPPDTMIPDMTPPGSGTETTGPKHTIPIRQTIGEF